MNSLAVVRAADAARQIVASLSANGSSATAIETLRRTTTSILRQVQKLIRDRAQRTLFLRANFDLAAARRHGVERLDAIDALCTPDVAATKGAKQ